MDFERELQSLINSCSKENDSNTPDFILAKYVQNCLDSFTSATIQRDTWYGYKPFGRDYGNPCSPKEAVLNVLSSKCYCAAIPQAHVREECDRK